MIGQDYGRNIGVFAELTNGLNQFEVYLGAGIDKVERLLVLDN